MGVGERVSVSELEIRLISKSPSPDITLDECTMLANTFWSGSAPNYHSTVDYDLGICVLTAHYANDARHAFYSLDEDGTITVCVPASSVCPRSSPSSADAACQTGCPTLLDTTAPQFYRLLG